MSTDFLLNSQKMQTISVIGQKDWSLFFGNILQNAELRATEDEMVGWHLWLKFGQAPGDSERQGSVVCCSSWEHKELDMTKQLNNDIAEYFSLYKDNFYSKSSLTFSHSQLGCMSSDYWKHW